MSISDAPASMASCVSCNLTAIDARPEGNAVETAATPTWAPPIKSKCARAIATMSL